MSDVPPILQHSLAGRYVVKREIGRGGAATVYLAHDARHERLVAIKVLHPELSHALGGRRFVREIKLTASLQHPHILPIHDSGTAAAQLYYVMPYLDGESLRERLEAEGRLSVAETVRIGREVADALAYAHERGIVHRDIKPENILFSGEHAVLADFGIARAINRASEQITKAGMITGTPAYMSPEQARDRAFDGRSDVYSLACVLYEAIGGVPPYVGDTPQALLSQRIATPPPLLREIRHDVPAPIEAVIARALAIAPDDRYDDARAFGAALAAAIGHAGGAVGPRGRRRPLARTPWLWAAGMTLLVAGGAASTPRGRDQLDILTGRVDSAQYAVVPFQYEGATRPAPDADPAASGMYDAMRRWDGLGLASEMTISDALHRAGDDSLSLAGASRIARSVHAGRLVWGRVRVTRDSLVIHAGVYDSRTGERIREVSQVVRTGSLAALAAVDYRALSTSLLRGPRARPLSATADQGTSSFAAWQAFETGADALARWELRAADSAFTRAVAADAAYPQANLWLAQLRFLQDSAPSVWASPLLAAMRARMQLDPREQHLAEALGAMARETPPLACREYAALRDTDSLDVMAWLGLAFCQSRDRAVVRSARSPSGFAFRGSAHAAWRAAARALELSPGAFVVLPYQTLRRFVPVEHNAIRIGHLGADVYAASPSLVGDTVTFAPMPASRLGTAPEPPGYDAALRRDRDQLLGVLGLLSQRLPESPDVFEALASLLETRDEITGTPDGRYSALTALERARMLATAREQRLRLAVTDVRLHFKLGDFARSTGTADSVLVAQRAPTPREAYWLQGLAAFGGHAADAARYVRLGVDPDAHVHTAGSIPAVEEALSGLLMRAALGLCDDSAAIALRSIDRTLASYVEASQRQAVRDQLLERALVLLAPCDGGRSALAVHAPAFPVTRLAQRLARGDSAGVRRALDSLDLSRRSMQPGAMSLDVVLLEAWLRDASGDPSSAANRLDVRLATLPALSSFVITEPVAAASIGRAMAYRAELAHRAGDQGAAALWAGRVLTLWSHADPALEPTMARMRRLAMPSPGR